MLNNLPTTLQQALQHRYNHLNPMQQEAVFSINGPLLILAGAGSGKTTVLINRIQYMVELGNAYENNKSLTDEENSILKKYLESDPSDFNDAKELLECNPVKPWSILAITFTNKAAGELKDRLCATLDPDTARDIQASTFHSLCMRILRRNIENLGYQSNFTVYDTDDSLRVIKDGISSAGLSDKMFPPRTVLSAISRAKDTLTTPKQMLETTGEDYRTNSIAKVYAYYQNALKSANALDFDDIIALTVNLFQKFPDVLDYYQNRYKYIMVDEYQDTNQAQYLLVSLLAEKHKNLCVVGDDDQSIYKFRGATIENILSFENQFDNAKVIRLEQNYRSTQNILTAANELISNNTERKGKNLWTTAGDGEKIALVNQEDELSEAKFIADTILDSVENGNKWKDHAILYRMNAQSNSIERALAQRAIPYRIVGGLRFYERKEIKDIVAYLSVLNNPGDNLRLMRIINEPKRGIGATTMSYAAEISLNIGEPIYNVLKEAEHYSAIAGRSASIKKFTHLLDELIELVDNVSLGELFDAVVDKTGYMKMLEAEGNEGITRIENILELKSNIIQYEENATEPSLSEFLEEISLYTDLDNYDTAADSVTLMTIHSAKGLEFPILFVAGMEEGVFPGRSALNFPEEIEEERRLAYVAVTRAKKMLYITHTQRRMLFGQTTYGRPSRFINELPKNVIEHHTIKKDLNHFPGSSGISQNKPKESFYSSKSSFGIAAPEPSNKPLDVVTGDRVKHKIFGEGTVISAKPMGSDTLIEINFDRAGVKKIMATFAKLSKV